VNIGRVEALRSAGLMKPAGVEAFRRRSEKRSRTYSYERREAAKLDPAHERIVKSNKRAWSFFESLAPSYRRRFIHWVTSAKSEEVRMRRLRRVIVSLEQGRKV
jgi:uncharacterized protein YdeI (YjbR/CyaY-like superfamily)